MLEREHVLRATNFFEGLPSPVVCVDGSSYDEEMLVSFADTITQMGNSCCYASSDEPLDHPSCRMFLTRLVENDVPTGLVTNGIHLNKFFKEIYASCRWVTIYMTASGVSDFINEGGACVDYFSIIENISHFIRYRPDDGPLLRLAFDIYPDNCNQVYDAAVLGKSMHVDKFTILPRAKENQVWYPEMIWNTFKTLDRVINLDDDTFQVSNMYIDDDDIISISDV